MADGHVQTIKDLNKYIENSFGFWSKAIYDPNYKIPSALYKGLMGNLLIAKLEAQNILNKQIKAVDAMINL